VGLDQTSSFRFEKWGADTIRQLGLRAIIGKTTMGERTAAAMRDRGCVHLTRVGVPGNLLAQKVKRVVDVFHLEEFGMTEATWVIEVEDLGPFIVDIDAQGRNLFHDVRAAVDLKRKALYRRFGIPEDFRYQTA
jgi:tartrate dehydratase beta subunit/fumarate hydratase class I family protein